MTPTGNRAMSGRDAPLRAEDELEELLDLGERGQLGSRPVRGLRQVEVGVEEEAIEALERPHRLVGEPGPLKPDRIEPVELDRVADRAHERGDVLIDPGAPADERERADGDELMDR